MTAATLSTNQRAARRPSRFGSAAVVALALGLLWAPRGAWTSELRLDDGSGPSPAPVAEQVVKLVAERFEYAPGTVTVTKGVPVVLELTSSDVRHGFSLPDFGVRAEVEPGEVSRVRFTPDKAGTFTFFCDVFCGSGHEDMSGTLVVTGE
jgi:cytochrome c oxidase subunit 2